MVARGGCFDPEIAVACKASLRTIKAWKIHPEFAARVIEILQREREAIAEEGIVLKKLRLQQYVDQYERMARILNERASDPGMDGVPGGKTGLILRDVKGIGRGDDFQAVNVYSPDTQLLKEMREWMKQAAIEMGQWVEKGDLTSGGAKIKGYVMVSPDDWDKSGD